MLMKIKPPWTALPSPIAAREGHDREGPRGRRGGGAIFLARWSLVGFRHKGWREMRVSARWCATVPSQSNYRNEHNWV